VEIIAGNKKEFTEYHMLRPSRIMLRLLRARWEDLTKTGKTPEYTLHFTHAYKPEID
jgi:hypothetical protein